MQTVLVIVPCGKSKIWDKQRDRGPTRAADAYIGTLFTLNRAYAERLGDRWIILSAKYGFVLPDFEIPETCKVTFNDKKSGPITPQALRRQVAEREWHRHALIVGLGGKAYRHAIEAAFAPFAVRMDFPFAGLPIGKMMGATKRAFTTGDPGFDRQAPG